MIDRKNFIYLAILCFTFLFLAINYERSDTAIKRMEQEVLVSNQLGVYKGDIAENFQLQNFNGEQLQLESFRGKKVIVNFFATWCAPCQEEMPILVALQEKVENENFVVIGVNVTKEEPNRKRVREFVEHFNVNFEVLYDDEGEVMDIYQLIGIPTTFFIDEEGKIVERINGIITLEMIKNHPFFEGRLN
ncbi:hypothetical protein BKP35_13550 [Anaerobacillus arseniciselenatis]|uniref:Thioredoxin domain-containing protein n=1 Tax=Anaerobacillus arseniciselenatis TaxID=85682 RepID=A0A1S2LF46_9BACI|nr:TlpA disulfide reductase family protein [Anaerobacillus arseniciselenatis]OIJ10135.1 hypothetical protein BKP35_13550 [Anaerobacillus arseniciselenatis]